MAALGAGFAWLTGYAAAIGAVEEPAPDLVAAIAPYRRPDTALAVMMIHPKCPCTAASISEFGDFLARAGDACDGLLIELAAFPGSKADAGSRSRSLGGRDVPVIRDESGGLARRLGAKTSGHIVLIDASGATRFFGGVTLARGHRGRAPGQDAMLAAIGRAVASTELCQAPVYGCSLESNASFNSPPR